MSRNCLYSRMVSDWPQETLVTTVMQVRDNIYLDCVNDQQDADHMSTVNTTFTTLIIGLGQWEFSLVVNCVLLGVDFYYVYAWLFIHMHLQFTLYNVLGMALSHTSLDKNVVKTLMSALFIANFLLRFSIIQLFSRAIMCLCLEAWKYVVHL